MGTDEEMSWRASAGAVWWRSGELFRVDEEERVKREGEMGCL